MTKYSEFRPTAFDCRGLALPDQQDWLVAPVSQNRDSGPIDLSNFQAALDALGGESDTVQVHRFGHWGPGWFEIILIDPADTARVKIGEDLETALSDYPLLDEEDFSRRELEDYQEGWKDYGASDFARALRGKLGLSDTLTDWLRCDCDTDLFREYFESLISSGEYYIGEDSGVSVNVKSAVFSATRESLAQFVRNARKAEVTA